MISISLNAAILPVVFDPTIFISNAQSIIICDNQSDLKHTFNQIISTLPSQYIKSSYPHHYKIVLNDDRFITLISSDKLYERLRGIHNATIYLTLRSYDNITLNQVSIINMSTR